MAKVSYTPITNLNNQSTAITQLNNNFAALQTAMEITLSRDGTSPNTMGATLDMNSNRIINLPDPTLDHEPLTYGIYQAFTDEITGASLAQYNLAFGTAGYALIGNGGSQATFQGFLQSGSGAVTQTWNNAVKIWVTPEQFGAVGDGVTDDTAAIQAALNSAVGVQVLLGAKTYKTSSKLILGHLDGLIGQGVGVTTITTTSADQPVIQIGSGPQIAGGNIIGMTITRSVPATVGGDGIYQLSKTDNATIADLIVQNQYIGLNMGTTNGGKIDWVSSVQNYSHGFYFTNVPGTPIQWSLTNSFAVFNDGYGFLCEGSTAATNIVAPLPIINFTTYANTLGGMGYIGADASHVIAVHSIYNSFIGSDGGHGIYLKNASANINSTSIELVGKIATGRNGTTPATNTGSAIKADTGVRSVLVRNCTIGNISDYGIDSQAILNQFIGNHIEATGIDGIYLKGAAGIRNVITGNQLNNIVGYGVRTETPFFTITGNDFIGTTAGPFISTVSLTASSEIVGNTPSTLGERFAGISSFVGNATPATNDGAALGTTSLQWADLFLANGGKVGFFGDVTGMTATGNLLSFYAGSANRVQMGTTALIPATDNGLALGNTTNRWSDLFLAEGGVINWDDGDATLTQVGDLVTLAGANLAAPVYRTTTALNTATDGSGTAAFTANMVASTGGPTTAAQNGWLMMQDSTGATVWVPVWK